MSTNQIRVAVLAKAGLGGTEKAATTYAVALVKRGYLVDYLSDHGPRENYLITHGVNVLNAGGSPEQLRAYLEDAEPHIVHQHVPGYPFGNPLYPALRQLREDIRKPKVIETNIFGRLEDPEAERFVDFRLFISMASAAQAFRRANLKPSRAALERQTVIYYPVEPVTMFESPRLEDVRQSLGLTKSEVLVIRVGRPGHKWTTWECEAFRRAHRQLPNARLLLMEPPAKICAKIRNGTYGPGIIVKPETSDFGELEAFYQASDIMLHASDWGESFGYTIAEAMAAGLPVITRSTPWGDSAQVELVKNPETGFVCWSVPEMARRLVDLTCDEQLRKTMGMTGRERILALANADREIELLEEVIISCLDAKISAKVAARNVRLLDFMHKFPALERNTSETPSDHPIDFLKASIHACYRKSRARLRSTLNRWQRGQMRTKEIS